MRSMTGFSKAVFSTDKGSYQFEIKSYNSKYLDCSLKLPKTHSEWEIPIQKLISEEIDRGRIEVFLLVDIPTERNYNVVFNEKLLDSYVRYLGKIKKILEIKDEVSLETIVALREVFSLSPKDQDLGVEWKVAREYFVKAIRDLTKMKESEGKFLRQKFEAQIAELSKLIAAVSIAHQSSLGELRKRYKERILELTKGSAASLDQWKLEQESIYYISRSDVSEECARIESHLKQFSELISAKGTMGRKMEFIVQELGREFNTIGSKSQASEVSRLVIDAKSLLDRVREQTMNIE